MGKRYLHQSICQVLLERIKSGAYPPGEKIPGTKELAREFDTSSITIDKALSSLVETGYISRTAKLGSFINSETDWPQDPEAGPAGTSLYSLLMRDSPSPYFWKNTVKGIHDAVQKHDFNILFGYIDENPERARDYIQGLHRKGVKGILFAPLSMPTEKEYEEFNAGLIDLIEEYRIPLVLVDRHIRSRDVSYVVSRDYEAGVRLTEHLFESGCRSPICLTHLYNSPFAARIRGFQDTLKARGFGDGDIEKRIIDIAPNAVLFDINDAEITAPVFRGLPDFDGIFAVNAVNLYACMNTLRHLRDPRMGSVLFVNVDDIGPLNIEGLSLSAVQQSHRIGYMAAEVLIEMVSKWRDSTFRVTKEYHYKKY
jgi:DNA-binding LacI/PurR family transcriptional regulator